MNVNEYISSGILESYIRGEVSDQERREVECLSKIYPEIRTEIDTLEKQLESYSRAFAQKAPLDLKATIMDSISQVSPEENDFEKRNATESPAPENTDESVKVIPISNNRWKPMIAASIILLLGVNIVLFFQFRKANEERKALISQFEDLNTNYEEQIAKTEKATELLEKVEGADSRKIILNSVIEGESYQMALFWNNTSGEVIVKGEQLPSPSENQQYQLWALVDGKPVDMGVIEKSNETWQEMLKTDRADAFAITLEKEGGSPTPTLEQMVVYGEV
jgi:anti-sigma-K factor RskA